MSELDFIRKATQSLEKDAVGTITLFLKGEISDDGGFIGRSGTSDLYYTHFGAGSLLALSGIDALAPVHEYISSFSDYSKLDFVHLCCLARCRAFLGLHDSITDGILSYIEKFRSSDGGYNHRSAQSEYGTTYAAFLAQSVYEEFGRSVSDWERVIEVSESGGGITTVTAALVVMLADAGEAVSEQTLEWLIQRHDDDGGFRASENAPIPDLLSTAASLYALRSSGVDISMLSAACSDFVEMLWSDDGGFTGTAMDIKSDCEYTYYGLMSLGCLAD
jgi:hypothetical protein